MTRLKRGYSIVWQCDECGQISHWEDGYRWFGSLEMEEHCPDDLLVACSSACMNKLQKKMRNKEIQLPKIDSRSGHKVRERKGY